MLLWSPDASDHQVANIEDNGSCTIYFRGLTFVLGEGAWFTYNLGDIPKITAVASHLVPFFVSADEAYWTPLMDWLHVSFTCRSTWDFISGHIRTRRELSDGEPVMGSFDYRIVVMHLQTTLPGQYGAPTIRPREGFLSGDLNTAAEITGTGGFSNIPTLGGWVTRGDIRDNSSRSPPPPPSHRNNNRATMTNNNSTCDRLEDWREGKSGALLPSLGITAPSTLPISSQPPITG